ncbi:MAG: hypothetical protein CMC59_08000 [Flavobacteriaceae bacterium]|nr:hypothetical protein [Flavobacteriaceae bacterium]|tara:strand:+ start:1241 stop:1588 length:348 start_codon:yes stop_codon:yes gene_type:complete
MNDLKFTTAGEYMSSPKVYEENIDYELTPASDNEYGWNVRILVGPFVETVIRFGNLAANEKEGHLSFNFKVIQSPDPDLTENDESLQEEAGKILNSIIERGLKDGSVLTTERKKN